MKKILLLVIALVFASGCIGSGSSIENDAQVNRTVKESSETNSSNITINATSSDAGTELKFFDVTVGHTFIQPSTITVSKGDKIRISVRTATGTEEHNHGITIDEYNINIANTDAGNPSSIEFTARTTGEFSIYCKTCWDGPYGKGHPDVRAKLIVK